jgi:hypothetical protein
MAQPTTPPRAPIFISAPTKDFNSALWRQIEAIFHDQWLLSLHLLPVRQANISDSDAGWSKWSSPKFCVVPPNRAPDIFGHVRSSPFSFLTSLKCVRSNTAKQLLCMLRMCVNGPLFLDSSEFHFPQTYLFLHNFSLSFGVLSSVPVADGNEMSERISRVRWNLPPPELSDRMGWVSSYVRVPRARGIPLQSNDRYFRNICSKVYQKIKLINKKGWTK